MAQRYEGLSATRSAIMASVGQKNTRPEIAVRRVAHGLGLRFRLQRRDLPGTPDLVFPSRKTVVFVHGCFWHRHPNCARSTRPKTRSEYWEAKFNANVARDSRVEEELLALGWRVVIIWECQTLDTESLRVRLRKLLLDEGGPSTRWGDITD